MSLLLPSDFDPSQSLKLERDERFAQLRATGVSLRRCFEIAMVDLAQPKTQNGLRQAGFRKGNEPAMLARIAYLRANPIPHSTPQPKAESKPTQPKVVLDRHGLLHLMGEVTEALSTAARELSAQGGNPKEIGRLRTDLVVHIRRLDRLKPTHSSPSSGSDIEFDKMLEGARAQWCSCPVVGGGE